MSEIKGYLLTEEEEKACVALVKKLRKERVFAVEFTGCVRIKAKSEEEASNIFWEWTGDLQDKSWADWSGVIKETPFIEKEGVEEE